MNEIDGETEEQRVRRMRNNYAIIDSNPLVRWMNSSAWTSTKLNPREEYCMQQYGRLHRGMAVKLVTAVPWQTFPQKSFSDVVSGEIECL